MGLAWRIPVSSARRGRRSTDTFLRLPAFVGKVAIQDRQPQVRVGIYVHRRTFAAHEFGRTGSGDHGGVVGGENRFGKVESQSGFGCSFSENLAEAAVGGDTAG